jgi:hypothetical protein
MTKNPCSGGHVCSSVAVEDPAELRLLQELEHELRTPKPNKNRRLTAILKQLNELRGRPSCHPSSRGGA